MKTTFKINVEEFEIEIKARDIRNLNASKKATKKVLHWIEERLQEASQKHNEKSMYYQERMLYNNIKKNASNIHNLINN